MTSKHARVLVIASMIMEWVNMIKRNTKKVISAIVCILLIIGCLSLFSCKGNNETDEVGASADSSYENADSASAESAKDNGQNTDDTSADGSTETDGSTSGFNSTELGGNNDKISWDDLINNH